MQFGPGGVTRARREDPAPLPPLPMAYIIGAPKAGTTSTAAWLAEHPAVFFSTPKEPYYWASDYPGLAAHYGFETLAAYASLFDCAAARAADLLVEGSTVYLYSETAVPRIMAKLPCARFVVCLRNPSDLLASYHRTQVVTLNDLETDFAKAWKLRAAGSTVSANPIDPKLVDYPLVGMLGAAVQRLLDVVPRNQVHFIVFDDLVHDPQATWRKLTDFLELAPDERTDFSPRNPSDSMFRFRLLRKALHRPPAVMAAPVRRVRQWSRTSNSAVVRRLKQATWRPNPKPELSPELRRVLDHYFDDDVHQLGRLIGQDLHWRWHG
jgi:hypothetical protein